MRLLYRALPRPNESLAGYLLHLANRNGYTFPQLFDLAGFAPRKFANVSNVLYDMIEVAPFAQLVGAPKSALANLVYPTRRHYGRQDSVRYKGADLPHWLMRGARSPVCPLCLVEDGYTSADWDLALATRCLRHGTMLIDCCPSCGERIHWWRQDISSCTCGEDLRTIKPVAAARLHVPSSADQLLRLAALVAFQLCNASSRLPLTALRDAPMQLLDTAVRKGLSALSRGDDGARALIRRIAKDRARRAGALGVRWPLLPLLREPSLGADCKAWIESLVADCQVHIPRASRVKVGVTVLPESHAKHLLGLRQIRPTSRSAWGLAVKHRKSGRRPQLVDPSAVAARLARAAARQQRVLVAPGMLSVTEASKLVGIYADAIRRVIKAGMLPARRGPCRTVNIAPGDLARFQDEFVFVKELAQRWRLTPTNLAERMQAFGCKPVSGPTIDGALVYLFRRGDVVALDFGAIAALRNYPTRTGRRPGTSRGDTLAPYLTAEEVGQELGLSVQKVSTLVRDGFLKEARPDGVFANRRYIARDTLLAYLAAYRDNKDLIRVDLVAKRMEIAIRTLNTAVIIMEGLATVSDGIHRYLLADQVEGFLQRTRSLLTSVQAAAVLGAKRHFIVNQVALGRLRPVSGPGVDSARNFRFLSEDIELIAERARYRRAAPVP